MRSKLKVAVIGLKGLPAYGGAATVGENLVNKLKNQYDFTVYSVASHTSKKTGDFNGYKQIVFKKVGSGGLNTLIYYLKSLMHCLTHNYDLIHLHHAESGFITPFLKLKYNIIVTFHGIFRDTYTDPKFSNITNRFFRFSEKMNVKFANEVVSVSKPDAEYVESKYSTKVNYIPNGIDIVKLATGENKEEYIVFAAGRIYEIKGLHLLLTAMHQTGLNLKLLVIGDLDQNSNYKEEIVHLAKGLNVEFKGLITNKEQLFGYIAAAKYFVFPSLNEAMSMMLLEVVSLKVPVIASDIESNKAVFNGEELVFFESKNPASLAEKLLFAQKNEKQMKEVAMKAFDKVRIHYNWEAIAETYNELYKSVLK